MTKQRALRLKAWLLTLCMVISLVPTAAFAEGNKTLKYVSLGDSMSNGYGLSGYDENTSGYNGYGTDAYPNQFEAWLEAGNYKETTYDVIHYQLAMSAMRAEDLHFLLEATPEQAEDAETGPYDENEWSGFPAGDKYTFDALVSNRFAANGGTKALAKAYQDAVADADVISLGIGNANFGVFLMENIADAFGIFGGEGADSAWMQTALNGCDDAMKEKLQALMNTLSAELTAQLSSLGDAAEPMVDAILYTVVSYLVNYAGVLDAIANPKEGLNPDAKVILVGIMDTTSGMQVSFEVAGEMRTLPLSTVLKLLVEPINTYIATLPAVLQAKGEYKDATFYYAAAPSVQCLVDTFDRDMFEGELTSEKKLIRKRFHKEIVGTENKPGFIWDMAGKMLGDLELAEGVNIELVYVSLEDITSYKAALDSNDAATLQENYIDPILNPVVEGEFATPEAKKDAEKDAANAAISKLLSLAFYLSIESTILEASDGAEWGHLDVAALTALTSGGLSSVFGPVMDAVKDPGAEYEDILDNKDEMIYDLIASIASEMATEKLGSGSEVTVTKEQVKTLLNGTETEIDKVFYQLAAEMVKTMKNVEFEGIGTIDLSKLGIDATAVENIYKGTEAGYTKLYEMAATMVSDMEELVVDGVGTVDPSTLNIQPEEIEAIYKVANGTNTAADKVTADNFYYRMVAILAPQLGYNGLEPNDIKSIMDPNYVGGLTANVFAVAQTMPEVSSYEISFTYKDNGENKTFTTTLGQLGLSADGKDLKAIYDFALDSEDAAKEDAANEVFYKIATFVANKTVFAGVDAAKQPDENIIRELITVDDGNYSEAVFKLAMDLAGDRVVYTIKDAENNDKNITLDQLNLSADGKDLKALYDYARNPVATNPNKAAAYGVYYKLVALVAPEMGLGTLEAADIESVIDETKMPTKAVFELALTKVNSGEIEFEYEGLTLDELGVDADDLMVLYYYAKGAELVIDDETLAGADLEAVADEVLYKIAAVVAKKDGYVDANGNGLSDTEIGTIVDWEPGRDLPAKLFDIAVYMARDTVVDYGEDGVVGGGDDTTLGELNLNGSDLAAVYKLINGDTTEEVMTAANNVYYKATVEFAKTKDEYKELNLKVEHIQSIDQDKIPSVAVFELAQEMSGNTVLYTVEDANGVDKDITLNLLMSADAGENKLTATDLRTLYKVAKAKTDNTIELAPADNTNAQTALYKIAAVVAVESGYVGVLWTDIEALDGTPSEITPNMFEAAAKRSANTVVGTDANGADITLGSLNVDGPALQAIYEYAQNPVDTNPKKADAYNVYYDLADAGLDGAYAALNAADVKSVIEENASTKVFPSENVFALALTEAAATQIYTDDGDDGLEGTPDDVIVTISDLTSSGVNQLTAADLRAIYMVEKGAKNADFAGIEETAQNAIYKIAAVIAHKTDSDLNLTYTDIANIIADPPVLTSLFQIAADKVNGERNSNLSKEHIEALYNTAPTDEPTGLALDAIYELAAIESGVAGLDGDEVASIVGGLPVTEMFVEAVGKVNDVDVTDTELEAIYWHYNYPSGNYPNGNSTIDYKGIAEDAYYRLAVDHIDYADLPQSPLYPGTELTSDDIESIVGEPPTPTENLFKLLCGADEAVKYGLTYDEIQAIYDYAKADEAGTATEQLKSAADAVYYKVAAKELSATYSANVESQHVFYLVNDDVSDDALAYSALYGIAAKAVNTELDTSYSAEDIETIFEDEEHPYHGIAVAAVENSKNIVQDEFDNNTPTAAATVVDAVDDVLADVKGMFDDAVADSGDKITTGVNDAMEDISDEIDSVTPDILSEVKDRIDDGKQTVIDNVGEANNTVGSEVVSAFTTEFEKVRGDFNTSVADINSQVLTTVDENMVTVKGNLTTAQDTVNNRIVSEVDANLNPLKPQITDAKTEINKQIQTNVNNKVTELQVDFNTQKGEISKEDGEFMTQVGTAFTDVRNDFRNAVYGDPADANDKGANGKILAAVNDNVTEVKNQFNKAKEMISGEDSEVVTQVETKLADVKEQFNAAQDKVSSLVKKGVDGARDKVTSGIDDAKALIEEVDLNTYFDLIRMLFTMDDLVPEAASESKTLMSILHLFSRMIVGNGLGAHPTEAGHTDIFEALTTAKTVQDELKKDVGVLLLGMGGLLVKFGADILGIALNSDTIQGYLNDLPQAAEDLYNAVNAKFADYETSKNTLNTVIKNLEEELNKLTARLEQLSTMMEGKKQELADAFAMAANANDKAADAAVKNLKAVVHDLATLIAETRDAIDYTNRMLGQAKAQLDKLETAIKELRAAAETLKNNTDSLSALLKNVDTTVTAFEEAYRTTREAVTNGIKAVKDAYDKAESALSQAKDFAAYATDKAEALYDNIYETLSKAYNILPADMALMLFGVVGGSAYMALTITEATLVDYANAKIAEKTAEYNAEKAKIDAKIQEKTDKLKDLAENSAEALQIKKEISDLEKQLKTFKAEIDAEIAELTRMVEERTEEDMAKLRADYQNLVETITSGARSEIKGAMENVVASGVKTITGTITTTIRAFGAGIDFVEEKLRYVISESRDVYGKATSDDYTINENSLYVALGDDVAAGEDTYVKLLANAQTATKTKEIKYVNLAEASQSIADAAALINENAETIKAADLITVGYGSTTFGKKAMDRANAIIDGEAVDPFDWEGYIGEAGAAYVKNTMLDIENSLKASDLEENYPEAVAAAIEAFAFYSVEYLCKMPSVINAIRDLNKDAVVVIVGMYNPLKGLSLTHGEGTDAMTVNMGGYLDDLISGMNVYGTGYAVLASRTKEAIFVATPDVDVDPVDEDVTTLLGFMAHCKAGTVDVLPTPEGQADIRDDILGALRITDTSIKITGDVTIGGDPMYGETLEIRYTNGNAGNNVKYQWYRNGVAIEGAWDNEYLLKGIDVGAEITAKVIGTNQYWGELSATLGETVGKKPYPYAEHGTVEIPYGDLISNELWGEGVTDWSWDTDDALYDEPLGEAGSSAYRVAIYDPAVTGKDAVTENGVVYSVYDKAKVKVLVEVIMSDLPVSALYNVPTALENLEYTGEEQNLIIGGSINEIGDFTDYVSIGYAIGTSNEKAPELADNEWLTEIPQGKNAGTYYVWYFVNGGINYPSIKDCVEVTIAKAEPTDYTIPTGLTATVGQTLADVTLPDGWTWVEPTTSVGAAGNHTFQATFTPEDTVNYNAVTVGVTIEVREASATTFEVSGKVTSFRKDANDTSLVTIKLYDSENKLVASAEAACGTNVEYTLNEAVPAGNYRMEVSKAGHVTREYAVTVANGAVALDVQIHLLGDANQDGKVNAIDISRIKAHITADVTGKNLITDAYQLKCADVIVGSINAIDISRIKAHIVGESTGEDSLWS